MFLLTTVLLALSTPTVKLHGTVLGEGKEPVAGATVFAASWHGESGTPVRTDENGAFTVAVRPGERYTVGAFAPGYVRELVATIAPNTGELRGIAISLQPTPALTVSVVDRDGRPVPAASVMVAKHNSGASQPKVDTGTTLHELPVRTTDDDGVVRLQSLLTDVGRLDVVVHAEGHETATKTVRWDGRRDRRVRIRLASRRAKTLRVLDESGAPVDGQVVFADRIGRWWTQAGRVLADPYDPERRLASLVEGRAVHAGREWPRRCVIISPQFGVFARSLEEAKGDEHTVTIIPGPRWRGRIVDDQGEPVAGIRVRISDTFKVAIGGDRAGELLEANWGPLFEVTTGADGQFDLPRLETESWPRARLDIRARGYLPPVDDSVGATPTDIVITRRPPPVELRLECSGAVELDASVAREITGHSPRDRDTRCVEERMREENERRNQVQERYADRVGRQLDDAPSWRMFVPLRVEVDWTFARNLRNTSVLRLEGPDGIAVSFNWGRGEEFARARREGAPISIRFTPLEDE